MPDRTEPSEPPRGVGGALDATGVDEPERFLQDPFSPMEDKVAGGINDRARGNEERLAAELFGGQLGEKNGATRS